MKKLICFVLSLIFAFSLCTAHADTYSYFKSVETNFPEDSMNSDNVAYVGGVYYMAQENGSIFYSYDAKSWYVIDGSYGAKIISDKKKSSDFLMMFYNGNLVKSYDGANFELIRKFDANTVIKYENNIYTAYEAADSEGANLYFSYNGDVWFALDGIKAVDGKFIVDCYPDRYIVNGINTARGTFSAIILGPGEAYLMEYDHITFDKANGLYAAVDKNGEEYVLYTSDVTGAEFVKLPLPDQMNIALASYYDGAFYIADANGYDAYKASPGSSWEWTGRIYMPVLKMKDKNGYLREVFAWHDVTKKSVGACVRVIDKNGKEKTSSVELSGDLKMDVYGSVLCAASSAGAVNLLSSDGVNWHQTGNDEAFSILNEYTLRGEYMFVDRTSNHNIYLPVWDAYEKIGEKGIEVRIEGHYIAFDQPPAVINDRTMVPLRAISEALGAVVGYDDSQKAITIEKDSNTIRMKVGADKATITYYDGAVYEAILDSPSVLINERTLVPVRFISEAFNMKVEWAASTKTVWITSK